MAPCMAYLLCRGDAHAAWPGLRFRLPDSSGPGAWVEGRWGDGEPRIGVTHDPRSQYEPGVEVYLTECSAPPVNTSRGLMAQRVRLVRRLVASDLVPLGILLEGDHRITSGDVVIGGCACVTLEGEARARVIGGDSVSASGSAELAVWRGENIKLGGQATAIARGHSSIRLSGDARATAFDAASVVAHGENIVSALDRAKVVAGSGCRVLVGGDATVDALGAEVECDGRATVWARLNARVTARGHSTVLACDCAEVRAAGRSRVEAYDRVRVRAADWSQVDATDRVQVIASGQAFIRASGKSRVAASDDSVAVTLPGVRVKLRGRAQHLEHAEEVVASRCAPPRRIRSPAPVLLLPLARELLVVQATAPGRFDQVAAVACTPATPRCLAGEEMLAVVDAAGQRLRLVRWGRDGQSEQSIPLPRGVDAKCVASDDRWIYLGGAIDDPALEYPVVFVLPRDDLDSSWRQLARPICGVYPGKAVDALGFRGEDLIAVDDVVSPRWFFVYRRMLSGLPMLHGMPPMMDGFAASTAAVAFGQRRIAVLSHSDHMLGSHSVVTLYEMATLDPVASWASKSQSPSETWAADVPVRRWSSLGWQGETLLIAGGSSGIGMIDTAAIRDEAAALCPTELGADRELPSPVAIAYRHAGPGRVVEVVPCERFNGCWALVEDGGERDARWIAFDRLRRSR